MMAPYGGRDEDSESTTSFSVMGDEETPSWVHVSVLRDEIKAYLGRNKRCLNILMVGAPGVGKSAFINSIATVLAGKFHTFVPSGHHGGDGRPINFFMKSYPDCCLDQEYGKPYSEVSLPTLVDMAGLPNESNKATYEEILRTVLYGRLPREISVAKAEEIVKTEGVDGLRKKCPTSNRELKIDRIIFVASANEKTIPEELIQCVVNTCRPSGTSNNPGKRTVPISCVITKMDKVDETSAEFKEFEKRLLGCLGLLGSEHQVLRCRNYCEETAPERTDHNSPEIDVPILKFFKQLVDPFLTVDFDEEVEDFSHLNPQKSQIDSLKEIADMAVKSVGLESIMLFAISALLLVIYFLLTGPAVDKKALQTTCLRVKDMMWDGGSPRSSCLKDLPELSSVCDSLEAPCCHQWLILVPVGIFSLAVITAMRHRRAT